MAEETTTAPITLSTKIDLKWLLVSVFAFGVLLATESHSRASFETESRARSLRLEKAVAAIQGDVKSINRKMEVICTDTAVMKNDYKHLVGLLEDLKEEVKQK